MSAEQQRFGDVLDELDLVGFSGLQSLQNDVLVDGQGNEFPLDRLAPYSDLFDPDSFDLSSDGTVVVHKISGKRIEIPIFRSSYDDKSSMVQVLKDPSTGHVSYAEVRGKTTHNDTFFVNTEAVAQTSNIGETFGPADTFLTFTAADINGTKIDFDLGDAYPAMLENEKMEQGHGRRLDHCDTYRVFRVAIVYDSPLCNVYGSVRATEQHVLAIVASASAMYERDMCVKMQLTDLWSPDSRCDGVQQTFSNFEYAIPCGGTASLLGDFTDWSRSQRDRRGIHSGSLMHFFTGIPRVTSTIGCAWTGTVSSLRCFANHS